MKIFAIALVGGLSSILLAIFANELAVVIFNSLIRHRIAAAFAKAHAVLRLRRCSLTIAAVNALLSLISCRLQCGQ